MSEQKHPNWFYSIVLGLAAIFVFGLLYSSFLPGANQQTIVIEDQTYIGLDKLDPGTVEFIELQMDCFYACDRIFNNGNDEMECMKELCTRLGTIKNYTFKDNYMNN